MSRPNANPLAEWFLKHVRAVRSVATDDESQDSARKLHACWSRLIIDPWLTETLGVLSRTAVARVGLPRSWAEDIADDVLLRLHEKLRADLTLGFDLAREAQFAPWLRTILYRHARRSAERLRRRMPDRAPLSAAEQLPAKTRSLAHAIDLAVLLQRLSPEQRSVAQRLAQGDPMTVIASDLGLSYKRVRMLVDQVRHVLQEHEQDNETDER